MLESLSNLNMKRQEKSLRNTLVLHQKGRVSHNYLNVLIESKKRFNIV